MSEAPDLDPPLVVFQNVRGDVSVNAIRLSDLTILPRVGEFVWLPGTIQGGNAYRVLKVMHFYFHPKSVKHYGLIEYYRRESGLPAKTEQVPEPHEGEFVIAGGSIRIQIDVESA